MKIHNPPMTFKDFESKAQWESGLAKNQDLYGMGVYRYASEWATRMEAKLKDGMVTLPEIAKQTSLEADDSGITGFMYGCAVALLSQVWIHGEQLRRWSNKDIQLNNEGEVANEQAGAVLNPALLNIG